MPRNPNKKDYSTGLPSYLNSFSIIEDPRTGGNKKHYFGEILFMVISGLLCGMNTFSEIEEFCKLQTDWLRKWIKLPAGIPRAQTFSNVFAIIDPKEFNQCLMDHLEGLPIELKQQIVAIDGKCLRGSHALKNSKDHAVSAWAVDSGVTLAQEFVAEKSNEITAIPKLLKMLDLEGHLVTIDAMGTHTHIAQGIIDKKADYLLALKGNQGNSHKEAIDHFEFALRQIDLKNSKNWSISQTEEKGHDRHTKQTVLSTDQLDWMDIEIRAKWPSLKSITVVENETVEISSGKERKKERRYYISSSSWKAEGLQRGIRLHWGIENQCHWVLDTCFREDHNQTRVGNAAKNMGAARRIVLNILKADKTLNKSLPKKRFHALLDVTYRESLLCLSLA